MIARLARRVLLDWRRTAYTVSTTHFSGQGTGYRTKNQPFGWIDFGKGEELSDINKIFYNEFFT